MVKEDIFFCSIPDTIFRYSFLLNPVRILEEHRKMDIFILDIDFLFLNKLNEN